MLTGQVKQGRGCSQSTSRVSVVIRGESARWKLKAGELETQGKIRLYLVKVIRLPVKIDKDKQLVILEEEHEDISPDELKEELPERQPRFVVYSYKYQHDDGRVSYPLCFIFSSPVGCRPEQQMMYAGSKNKLVQTVELTKVFEIRNTEDLTEEWLREKLGFFR